MSTTIDKKIVEMRFNNADFERNAAQSMKTVDRLKKSMQFDNSGDALDRIAKSVERLESRFSALGIVGKRVLENITDSVINLEKRFTGFIVNGIKSGGISRAMNLENARFTMQGLLKDEEKVAKVMTAVSNSVDGTAYSLDQAATIAAQFVASGKQADEIEGALKGVAGAAAVTNSDFSSMGRIFAQVAGQGRLMGNDLLQLSTRGLNAAATLSDFMNAINTDDVSVANVSDEVKTMVKDITAGATQTEATVRDLVSKSKVSFDIFAAAMNNAFADQAAKANDTFTGSLSNIKAALARIGAEFVSPLIKQKGPFVKLFNTIREKVNDVKMILTTNGKEGNFLSPAATFVKMVTSGLTKLEYKIRRSDFNKIIRPMYNIQFALGNIIRAIRRVIGIGKDAFSSIFPKSSLLKTIITITAKFGDLTKKLMPSAETADRLHRIFSGLFSLIKVGITFVKSFIKVLGPGIGGAFKIGVDSALEFFARIGDVLTGMQKFVVESKTFEKVFNVIRIVVGTAVDALVWLGDIVGNVFGWIIDKITTFADGAKTGIGGGFKNLIKSIGSDLSKFGSTIKDKVSSIWNSLSFSSPVKPVAKFLESLKDAFANSTVFSFILGLFTTLKNGVERIIDGFKNIRLNGITGFMSNLRSKFTWLDNLIEFFKAVWRVIKFAGTIIVNAIKDLGHMVGNALNSVLPGWTNALNAVVDKNGNLVAFGSGLAIGGGGVFAIVEIIKKIKKAFETSTTVGQTLTRFNAILTAVGDTLRAFQMKLKAEALKSIATSIVMMAGSLVVLSMIPAEALGKAIVALTTLVIDLVYAMKAFGSLQKPSTGGADGKKGPFGFLENLGSGALTVAGQLLMIAGALTVLTGIVVLLGLLPYETLVKGLVTVTVLIRVITAEVSTLAKASQDGIKGAGVILALATAINMLILPLITLGGILKLSPSLILAGGGAVGALLLALGGVVVAIAKFSKDANPKNIKLMTALIGAIALGISAMTIAMSGLILAISGFSASVGGEAGGISLETGGMDRLGFALLAMLGLMASLFLTAFELMKYSKDVDPAKLKSVSILFGVIGAVIVGLVAVTTKLAGPKLRKSIGSVLILGAVNKIVKTMAKLFKNLANVQSTAKGAQEAVRSMAVSALIISSSIAIITGCIIAIAKVGAGETLKALGVVGLVLSALVAFSAIMSKVKFVETGVRTLAIALGTIAAVAVSFAAAVWLIVDAIKQLASISSGGIDTVVANMEALLQGIIDLGPLIADAIGAIVGNVAYMILNAIGQYKIAFIRAAISMLSELLDSIAKEVPGIAKNLVKIIVTLLDTLGPQLGIIADRVVAFVAKLISAVAKALDKHKMQIINAIDKLMTAVSKVVAGVIGRIIGLEGKKLTNFIDKISGKLKIIIGLITALKLIAPIKKLIHRVGPDDTGAQAVSGLKKVIATLKAVKANMALTGGGVEGLAQAMQNTAAASEAAGAAGAGMAGKIVGGLGKVMAFLGPHGLLVVGALAAATAVGFGIRALLQNAIDNMDVVDSYTEYVTDLEESVAERHERVMNNMSEFQQQWSEDIAKIREETMKESGDSASDYAEQLKKVVDNHGKVKKGMEDEAQTLVSKLNPELDNTLQLEDGILTINGQRIDSYKELEAEIDNYMKKFRAQKFLERYESKYDEASDRIRELQQDRITAQQNIDDIMAGYADELKSYGINTTDFAELKAARETISAMVSRYGNLTFAQLESANAFNLEQLRDALTTLGMTWNETSGQTLGQLITDDTFSGFDAIFATATTMTEAWTTRIEKANQEINQLDQHMSDYESLSEAVAKGDWDRIDELTVKLQNDMVDRTHATEEELGKQFDAAKDNADSLEKLSKDSTARITQAEIDEAKKRIEVAYEEWAEKAKLEGVATEEIKARRAALDQELKELGTLSPATKELDKLAASGKTLSDVFGSDKLSGVTDILKGKGLDVSSITGKTSLSDLKSLVGGDLSDFGSLMEDPGADGVTGFATGWNKNSYKATDAAENTAYGVVDRTMAVLDEHSPSKVFMEIGRYVTLGFAKGIISTANLPIDAISKVATLTIAATNAALANQGKVSVKPIVDLSAIQNGSIQGMLNGRSLALNSNVSSQIAASINSTQFEAQMDKISDQLRAMHSDMITIGNNNTKGLNNLGRTINGMQVVMNTGALVGQIAAPIDSAIGGIAAIKKRG